MALKKVKQTKDGTWTYTLMATTESSEPQYVLIDNHRTNENSVLVPFASLTELFSLLR